VSQRGLHAELLSSNNHGSGVEGRLQVNGQSSMVRQ
jgi:hypothetical protein